MRTSDSLNRRVECIREWQRDDEENERLRGSLIEILLQYLRYRWSCCSQIECIFLSDIPLNSRSNINFHSEFKFQIRKCFKLYTCDAHIDARMLPNRVKAIRPHTHAHTNTNTLFIYLFIEIQWANQHFKW